MLERDRGQGFTLITAITCVFILLMLGAIVYQLGWKNGEAIGENVANSDTYSRHAQEDIEKCLALPEENNKSKCIREVIESSNEHERAEDDLIAQENMGLWALGMLIITAVMTVVTGIGVVFIYRTLVATQKMASDQNKLIRYQVLPYIAISGFAPEFRWNEAGGFAEGRIEISIKNSGKSPAIIVGYSSKWEATNSRGSGGADGNLVPRELATGDGFGIIRTARLQPVADIRETMHYTITFRIRWTDLDSLEDYHRDVKYSFSIPTASLNDGWRPLNSRFHGPVERQDDWMNLERYEREYMGPV